MITHFSSKSKNIYDKIDNKNINDILSQSQFFEIINIEKLNLNETCDILNDILEYEKIYIINDYREYMCPNCKKYGTFKFHKLYERNLIIEVENCIISGKMKLVVLECIHCKQKREQQHYHTLFPNFIFPYHISSGNIILKCLEERIVKKHKINQILEKHKISHQLFYNWIKIMNYYQISSSIILKIPVNIENILFRIQYHKLQFLKDFYQQYFHPFFLFKKTCVPLAITP